ncbi:MAG: hypothetical protein HY925_11770 [Elusimicrobia bacterium]|nr:hypothetical protein [Elusimicrobiota bacterium]
MILALWLAGAALAAPVPEELPRKVAVLYRSSQIPDEQKDVFFHPFHVRAEIVMNYLGIHLDYIDADKPLPDPSLPGYVGVAAWLPAAAAFEDPRPACKWLEAAMRAGKRVALVGELGFYNRGEGGHMFKECSSAMRLLGLQGSGYQSVDGMSVNISSANSSMVGFERRVDPSERGTVPRIKLLPGATAYLTLQFTEKDEISQPVAITPRGGIALDPFWLYFNSQIEPHMTRWVTDPFKFFEAVFGLKGLPRPDVATLNGRRVFLSQIDGDGFYNLSELDRHKISGEIFMREIIAKYPDMPFTVGLVAGYMDLQLYNDASSLDISRRVMASPNVEAASHGYAHPLVWRTGKVAVNIPRYKMTNKQEIDGSIDLIESRVLPGKKDVKVFLWTGDCLPSSEAFELLEKRGIIAMNGGGGRMDHVFPTYSMLFPFTRPIGRFRQVYTPMPNEEDYTEVWTERFYGFKDVIGTFERTAAPKRIKPMDVYVHFYTAERYAALAALKTVLDWVRTQPVLPVFASRYIRSGLDFDAVKIARAGPRRWRFSNAPNLRTIRFDSEVGWPDVAASKGVIGYRRELGSLYIFLDTADDRELVLAEQERHTPHLEEASFEIEGWSAGPEKVAFKRRGWWSDVCVLSGMGSGRSWKVTSGAFSRTLSADAAGRLTIEFPDAAKGRDPLDVRVERAG